MALDLELDDELRQEGTAREVVRAVNDLRKAVGLELSDRIAVALSGPESVIEAVSRHQAWISGEVLAVSLDLDVSDAPGDAHELDIDGALVTAHLSRVP